MGRFIKKNQDDHKNSDSQSSDSQNFYFIDNIYATRIHLDGQLEYFVSWKGYPESENCWIPKYTVHHQNQTKSSKTVNSFSSSSPSENSNSPYQISNDPNHESSSSDVKESTQSKRVPKTLKKIRKPIKGRKLQISHEICLGIRTKELKIYPQFSIKLKAIYAAKEQTRGEVTQEKESGLVSEQ